MVRKGKKSSVELLAGRIAPQPHAPRRGGGVATALPALFVARPLHVDPAGDVVIEYQQRRLTATIDESVDKIVVEGAIGRGERLVFASDASEGAVIIGALRTQPTPGIDIGTEYEIRANRVTVRASDELSLSAGTASLVLRAHGMVETIADNITSRAAAVHKVIGRILRLN